MSLNPTSTSFQAKDTTDIYTDLNGLQNLKMSARKNARDALPEVARQFESVMISMMMKNLRKTGMEDPIFSSQAMDTYRDMYDNQLSLELSKGRGIGLADSIVRQLQQQVGTQDEASETAEPVVLKLPQRRFFPDQYSASAASIEQKLPQIENQPDNAIELSSDPKSDSDIDFKSPEQFVETLWPLAEKTAIQLGVSPEIILSQAALETGWGKYVISNDNQSSFNLFNIKAGSDWQGKRIEKVSMEYHHGKPIQQKSEFRAYDSFAQSFEDYSHFIQNNSRYSMNAEQSLHDKTYINNLHRAGYATDPQYSDKVLRVLNSDAIQNQRQKT